MNIYESMALQASKSRITDGDYIKNGLYHCGKCNTPKQCKIRINGREIIVFCLCKCETDVRNIEQQEIKKRKLYETKIRAFGSSEKISWNFENDDGKNSKLTEAMKKFSKNFDFFKEKGKGILLYGGTGTGKSYAAAQVVNQLIDEGRTCYMTNMTKIANDIMATWDEKNIIIDRLKRYDLLVIDDFSAERKTEFMQEAVYNVINGRYEAKLPLIITTNLTADELRTGGDLTFQRTYSRICKMCHPILVNGEDRRKATARDDYKTIKDILGV